MPFHFQLFIIIFLFFSGSFEHFIWGQFEPYSVLHKSARFITERHRQGIHRPAPSSMMELCLTIVNDSQTLTIVTESSISDIVEVLDPTLMTTIFTSNNWILTNLKHCSAHLETSQLIWMGKKMRCYYVNKSVNNLT